MPCDSAVREHCRTARLMGNRFSFTVVCDNPEQVEACLDAAVAEVQRIENLLTTFNEESQTAAINRMAGIAPVVVDKEVFDLVSRTLKISVLTQGAFDITYGSLDKSLWNFDTRMTALPDAATAKQLVRLINFRNVLLNEKEHSIMLKEKGMRIGFGGIGKGYAADRVKAMLQQRGIASGVVNASGDLITWGLRPDNEPWTIGIADPNARKHPFSYLNISGRAVATSGNYEKYVVINGKKYAHTIDPKTGYPVSGIKSVTIIAPSAELADALATPVMVMGVSVGLNMINQLTGVACIVIDEDDRLFTSNNIKITQA